MAVHLGQQAQFANPRFYTCYSYEDLVGRMQRVAMKKHLRAVPAEAARDTFNEVPTLLGQCMAEVSRVWT
eukprot:6677171-Alexandrium_andersonii.AAC.1